MFISMKQRMPRDCTGSVLIFVRFFMKVVDTPPQDVFATFPKLNKVKSPFVAYCWMLFLFPPTVLF